jgi:addiction module RelE/StbE family toxin
VRLHWTGRASRDREAIFDYIQTRNPPAALDLDDRFDAAARRLLVAPALGRSGRKLGTRELVVHRHYILIYDVVGDVIRVLRVFHTARQWPKKRIKPSA